jgi:hypothetical protein
MITFEKSIYPVQHLSAVIRDLSISEYNDSVAAMELIGPMSFAVAAGVCCALVDVQIPNGKTTSTVTSTTQIAGTGHGKSYHLNRLISPIRKFVAKQKKHYDHQLVDYESMISTFEIKTKNLRKAIERADACGDDVSELQLKLRDLIGQKPIHPLAPKLIFKDATPEALIDHLAVSHHALHFRDEGSSFFNGQLIRSMPFHNNLWDSQEISVERKTSGVSFCPSPRVGTYIALQNEPFDRFIRKFGREAVESGYMPRQLFSYIDSTAPVRYFYAIPPMEAAFEKFAAWVTETLTISSELVASKGKRTVLKTNTEAADLYLSKSNFYRSETVPNGLLSGISGFAHKAPEQALRIAGIFCYLEREPMITFDILHRAFEILEWHMSEYLRIFSHNQSSTKASTDAAVMEQYFLEQWRKGSDVLVWAKLLQNGPYRLRNAVLRDAALRQLQSENKIRLEKDIEGIQMVVLNLEYFRSIDVFGRI